jgi:glycosyltransferase 2 family protein
VDDWERGLQFWNSFQIIFIGFMGNNILPARLGEVLRAHVASAKINNEHGRTATLASIAIEWIIDGFVIAIISLVGMSWVSLETRLFWGFAFVCTLFFFLTTSLLLGISFHGRIRWICDGIRRMFPGHLTRFGREKLNFFLNGLLTVHTPRLMLAALLMTESIWGVELLSYQSIAETIFPEFSLK